MKKFINNSDKKQAWIKTKKAPAGAFKRTGNSP